MPTRKRAAARVSPPERRLFALRWTYVMDVLPTGSSDDPPLTTRIDPICGYATCTHFFEVLPARPGEERSATYLKCNAEMDVSAAAYLARSLILEGDMIRRLAR